MTARAYLLAEIGVNHDGDLARAAEMIQQSATAGFDGVKFQYWVVEELLAAAVPTAPYQGHGDQRDLLASLALSIDELAQLRAVAEAAGIEFVITPDGPIAYDHVIALRPHRLKVGSGDADNPWLLDRVASSTGSVILSTGMMTDAEVVTSARRLKGVADLTVLHCVSAYPTALQDLDLARMRRLGDLTGRPVGLSDHTLGVVAPAAALALGASFVEKHVTWSLDAPGPDHSASLELSAAARWVADLRRLEAALHTTPELSEQELNRPLVRKGLYSTVPIQAGQAITLAHLTALRPVADGIPASERDSIIGRSVRVDLPAGHLLVGADLVEE